MWMPGVCVDKTLLYLYISFWRMFSVTWFSAQHLVLCWEFCIGLHLTFSNLFVACRTQSLSCYHSDLIIIAFGLCLSVTRGLSLCIFSISLYCNVDYLLQFTLNSSSAQAIKCSSCFCPGKPMICRLRTLLSVKCWISINLHDFPFTLNR